MNGVNGHILSAVLVIGAAGVVNAYQTQRPVYRILLGSGMLLIVLSILDMFGGPLSKISSALAMVAVVYALLTVFPWATITQIVPSKEG